MNHPQELLAPFVDGTATLPERAEVEAHLSFCPACRKEVELARTARAALMALPDLESPGLQVPSVQPADAAEPAGPVTGSEGSGRFVESPPEDLVPIPAVPRSSPPARRPPHRPARRWPVRVAQAAVGVAAISLAVVLVSNRGNQSNTSGTAGVPRAPAAAPSEAAQLHGLARQAYTAKSLRRLASDLVHEVREGTKLSGGMSSPLVPAASPADSASLTERATSCIEQGTGVVTGTRLYFVQQALYEGSDAYIGAFLSGTGSSKSLLVVAVTVDGCDALQFIRQAV
jgi:anti-sigma factor RsiW